MPRYIFQSHFVDGNGSVVVGATVTVYLTGTSTLATIYAASSGGSAISGSAVTTSATDGSFSFWADTADYAASQKFRIVLSKANYSTKTYDDIAVYPDPGAQALWAGTAGGTKNALTLTPDPKITEYETGKEFVFKAGATSSDDAVTISISGLTTKACQFNDAACSSTIIIEANKYYKALYDGAAFQLTRLSFSLGAFPKTTFAELVTLAAGADIASAATIDLTAATGNCPRITGATATSAVTMNTGQLMIVVADGLWPLTYHATTNRINTKGGNYTCTPGDKVLYYKDASGVVHGVILPIAAPGIVSAGAVLDANASGTSPIFHKFTSAYATKFGTVYRNAAVGTDNSMAIVQTGGTTPTWEVMDVAGQNPNADLTTGYAARFKITYGVGAAVTGTLSATGNVALAATKKLYLDGIAGTGDTYLVESSANVFDFYVGGIKTLSLNDTTAAVIGALSATGLFTLSDSSGSSIKAVGCYNGTTGAAANLNVDSSGFFTRSTSSIKYKKDVQDAAHGLDDLLKLRPVTYKGTAEKDGDTVFGGLIAEEVHAAGLTEFVQYADDGSPDALAYGHMVSLCIGAIKELTARIAVLEAK